jgi:hypothetical protein
MAKDVALMWLKLSALAHSAKLGATDLGAKL